MAGSGAGHGLTETVWFVRDGNLTALDPSGAVHDSGVAAEGVLGYTSERVYAFDRDSQVIVQALVPGDEGSVAGLRSEPSPVPGAVQSAALSADGRYLAWLDLGRTVTVYDLKAEAVAYRVRTSPDSYVAAVGSDGVLVSENVDLSLRSPSGRIPVPTQEAGDSTGAQLAGGLVLVSGPQDESRLYDLSSGTAVPVATVPGSGAAIAPYGVAEATVRAAADGPASVLVTTGSGTRPVTGLTGTPDTVRWADERSLLVVTRAGGSSTLFGCALKDLTCTRLPVDGASIQLGR